jgi:hypothetical protein
MWDTACDGVSATHLSHDRPCPRCAHAGHDYLPCDRCDCRGRAHDAAPADDREPARLG